MSDSLSVSITTCSPKAWVLPIATSASTISDCVPLSSNEISFGHQCRGVCPFCNARRMAETAVRLVDYVLPPLQMRQWVLAVPNGCLLLAEPVIRGSQIAAAAQGRLCRFAFLKCCRWPEFQWTELIIANSRPQAFLAEAAGAPGAARWHANISVTG